jgi:antitoxin (DNA-binding transcriptional repressor) of toxin-antitoxin stability system
MKLGIKEFRERISEVTASGEQVLITHHGKPVASYAPFKRKDPKRVREVAESIIAWQDDLRAKGVDLDGMLATLGLDPMGVPLDESDR